MRSTLTLRALGLCVLLTAAMAIPASGAQAAGTWMINNANVGGQTQEVKATLDNSIGRMLTEINGLSIEVTCTAVTESGIKLNAAGLTTNGKATFTGCEISETSPVLKKLPCNLKTNSGPVGTVETTKFNGDIVLHEEVKPVSLLKPEAGTGKPFAELETSGCALPELIPVFGEIELEDGQNLYENEQVTHLLQEEPALTKLYVINMTKMEHLAKFDGAVQVSLENNPKWSGLAE